MPKRIFVAVEQSPNGKQLPFSQLWTRNLIDPLKDLGYELIPFDFDLAPYARHANSAYEKDRAWQAVNRPVLEEALLKQIKAAQEKGGVDLFFSYFCDAHVTSATVKAIKAMGIPAVNWFCNGSFQLHMVKEIAPAYDYSLAPEKFRLADYRAMGANPIYFQEGANPNYYKPVAAVCDRELTFVGQCYGDRVNYVEAFVKAGVPLKVYGPGWAERVAKDNILKNRLKRLPIIKELRAGIKALKGQHLPYRALVNPAVVGGVLSDDELVANFSCSRLNLGLSQCGDTDKAGARILQVRLRDMEVTMSGGAYLVEEFEELGECFEYGKEIIGYRSMEEMVDKAKYYLSHEQERAQIAAAGHARALRDHTWQKRFSDLFKQIGI